MRPVLNAEDAPFFYANFVEVGHSNYDFTLLTARMPGKLSKDQRAAVEKAGELEVPAELQIVIPPKVAVGLIKALQTQVDAFEKTHGPISGTKREQK